MEELEACWSRSQKLANQEPALVAGGDQLVSMAIEKVTSSLSLAMRDLLTQLPSLVDLYQATFDPSDPAHYKEGLFVHFEQQLSAGLDRASSAAVAGMYRETQDQLIGEEMV